MLNIIIEGILSLFLVFIMAFIAYSIYNNEYVNRLNNMITIGNRKKINIFTGRFEFDNKQTSIETYNPNYIGYKDINPSRNQMGGAEYSYNFWVFFHIDNNTNKINNNMNETDYIILFFKGSKLKTMKYDTNNYECNDKGDKKILIKNPLVKIRNDGKELLVEYNNINFPETYNTNAKPLSCSSLVKENGDRKNPTNIKNNELLSSNKFGIKDIETDYYNDKFNMVTIVFQENPSNEEVFNNKNANYKIFLNGELVSDRLANTNNIENDDNINNFKSRVIKNNNNKLNINPIEYDNIIRDPTNPDTYINPETPQITLRDQLTKIQPLQLANFTYFNYALSSAEINGLYKKGYNTELATINNSIKLSDYDYKVKYINYPTKELSKGI